MSTVRQTVFLKGKISGQVICFIYLSHCDVFLATGGHFCDLQFIIFHQILVTSEW